MGTDPVDSHHGTWISQLNSINSTNRYSSHDLKCHCRTDICPQSITINLGLESEIGQARPTVTPLGWLPASCIGARGVVWAHIQVGSRKSEDRESKILACRFYNTLILFYYILLLLLLYRSIYYYIFLLVSP